MNIFRFAADMTHLLSIFLLLFKITQSRTVEGDLFAFLVYEFDYRTHYLIVSIVGISLKSQELYLLVFVSRYLDLIFYPHSWTALDVYNSIMKGQFLHSHDLF